LKGKIDQAKENRSIGRFLRLAETEIPSPAVDAWFKSSLFRADDCTLQHSINRRPRLGVNYPPIAVDGISFLA
jgi:hypothetical protein